MSKLIMRFLEKFLKETQGYSKQATERYIKREIKKIPPMHPTLMKGAGWKKDEIDEMSIEDRVQCIGYVLAGLVHETRKKQKEASTTRSPPPTRSHPPS